MDRDNQEEAVQSDGRNVRRRLRLMWRNDNDPHVRQAEALVQNLVRRVGPIARGSALPLAVRQQRWSPINVPLLWAAAGAEPTNPVLNWLRACVAGIVEPISFHGGECSATEALAVGFNVLRATMRSWGISNPEDLSEWLSRHGFPFVRPGNHLSARAQEHIFAVGSRTDARIAIFEAVYVLITVKRSRQDIGQAHGSRWIMSI